MNILTQLSLTACISLSLVACGGGGGGGSSSHSSGTGASSIKLKDLKIDSGNALESVYHVSVDVALSSLNNKQAYISICDNSEGVDNINYDQCMVKAALKNGQGQFDLRVANHCESLVAVISVMEAGAPAMVYQHHHNNQTESSWYIQ